MKRTALRFAHVAIRPSAASCVELALVDRSAVQVGHVVRLLVCPLAARPTQQSVLFLCTLYCVCMFLRGIMGVHESDVAVCVLVCGRQVGPVPLVADKLEACPPVVVRRPLPIGILVDEVLRTESRPSSLAAYSQSTAREANTRISHARSTASLCVENETRSPPFTLHSLRAASKLMLFVLSK